MSENDRRPRLAVVAGGLAVAAVVLVVALLASGGADDDDSGNARPVPRSIPQRPVPQGPAPESAIVPRGAERVIRRWLAAVRASDFEKAASYFAIPSRVQNGPEPQTLDNPAVAIAWNASLPCGAVLTSIQPGFDGAVVARFRLTERPGGDCGSGTGAPAASRIKIRDGRITEWIRLVEEREVKYPKGTPLYL